MHRTCDLVTFWSSFANCFFSIEQRNLEKKTTNTHGDFTFLLHVSKSSDAVKTKSCGKMTNDPGGENWYPSVWDPRRPFSAQGTPRVWPTEHWPKFESTWDTGVCVECLIWKTKLRKPILFKVTEPSSIPYRTHPACVPRAAYHLSSYPDPQNPSPPKRPTNCATRTLSIIPGCVLVVYF